MHVRYVVLYVNDEEACCRFWVEQVGMIVKERTDAGDFTVIQVGFSDQEFAFELVPRAMMAENPDGLDLATPSIALYAVDIESARKKLVDHGVPVTEVGEHGGVRSFAFSDPEGRWFAVTG